MWCRRTSKNRSARDDDALATQAKSSCCRRSPISKSVIRTTSIAASTPTDAIGRYAHVRRLLHWQVDRPGLDDVLKVETRHLRGSCALDPAGMPTHADNRSIIKERFLRSSNRRKCNEDSTFLAAQTVRPLGVPFGDDDHD